VVLQVHQDQVALQGLLVHQDQVALQELLEAQDQLVHLEQAVVQEHLEHLELKALPVYQLARSITLMKVKTQMSVDIKF
jgi:hypothetical protein